VITRDRREREKNSEPKPLKPDQATATAATRVTMVAFATARDNNKCTAGNNPLPQPSTVINLFGEAKKTVPPKPTHSPTS